jgi:hypothetical protein
MDAQALADTQQDHTRVSRKKLLKRLKETRDHHVKAFDIAIAGWRQTFAAALRENATKLSEMAGKAEDESVDIEELRKPEIKWPVKPESHEDDYKTAIARFSMSLDDHIWLSHSDFNQLVMDNWHWRAAFRVSGRIYAPPGVYTQTTFGSPELSADFLESPSED